MEPDSSCHKCAQLVPLNLVHTTLEACVNFIRTAGVCIRTKSVGSRFLLCRSYDRAER